MQSINSQKETKFNKFDLKKSKKRKKKSNKRKKKKKKHKGKDRELLHYSKPKQFIIIQLNINLKRNLLTQVVIGDPPEGDDRYADS